MNDSVLLVEKELNDLELLRGQIEAGCVLTAEDRFDEANEALRQVNSQIALKKLELTQASQPAL